MLPDDVTITGNIRGCGGFQPQPQHQPNNQPNHHQTPPTMPIPGIPRRSGAPKFWQRGVTVWNLYSTLWRLWRSCMRRC